MGQIEKVIRLTREIETLLNKIGAEGRGLHEKISSVQNELPEHSAKNLRWIATMRNKTLHEHNFRIHNFIDFRSSCRKSISDIKDSLKKKSKREGCFIATAVYGDYNCEEVKSLRTFRDNYLKKNIIGRSFICLYYLISPSIAKHIDQKSLISNIIRYILTGLINQISAQNHK